MEPVCSEGAKMRGRRGERENDSKSDREEGVKKKIEPFKTDNWSLITNQWPLKSHLKIQMEAGLSDYILKPLPRRMLRLI
jgi:hypothetical protein